MSLVLILLILALGLLLIFAEVFLIPGTSLLGIIGGVAVVIGVVLVYKYYGNTLGHVAFAASLVLSGIAIYLGFKVIDSNKLAMKGEIKGKVNELEHPDIMPGNTGKTVTELRPNGKAIINGNKTDVYSTGDYISRETEIEVIRIDGNKILVKPLNT
jgi:membrane-bound ClpP family serine protease